MPTYLSTSEDVRRAVLGGAFLGGGGGGSIDEGMSLGSAAISFGTIEVLDVKEAAGLIVGTVSSVGSQAAGRGVLTAMNYVEAFLELAGRVDVDAVISSENGGMNTVASWPIAAGLGIPLIDAPADGRAHPTGLMGSMGLHRVEGYLSIQAFSVGRPGSPGRLRGVVEGSLDAASSTIRSIAASQGVLAVVRNPVDASYLGENAAVGGLSLALELGGILLDHWEEPLEAARRIAGRLKGTVIEGCRVEEVGLETRGGFDLGAARLRCGGRFLSLGFVNEIMFLEEDGRRLATFPDLVTPMRTDEALPLLTADLEAGQELILVIAPWRSIPLGAGLRYREAYEPLEKALEINLTSYIEELLVRG